MPIHLLKLREKKSVARNTIELVFEKPVGFTFKAGQYGGFTLINPNETDDKGITRRFSLLNSPYEDVLRIATRLQNSAYKRVLNLLPIGSEIKFAGPVGNFVLHEEISVPAIFIAGGIGITPFYSMIATATHLESVQSLTLFYGNQTLEDAPYFNELQQFQLANPNFKIITTLAAPPPHWPGEHGFITDEVIKKYIPDLHAPIYYICGSSSMVNALHEILRDLGISADRIRIEDFPGY